MKKILIISALMLSVNSIAQNNYQELINKFRLLTLPITDIENYNGDSLNNAFVNNYLMFDSTGRVKRPMFKQTDGKLYQRKEYVGRYPIKSRTILYDEDQPDGTWVEKELIYHPRINAIGRLILNSAFVCIVIRIETDESIYYDLWSLSKEGKPLSQICLYYGYKKTTLSPEIEYLEVESDITAEKQINWHSNLRGLHTYITWQLSEDGYFQVKDHRQEGEFEY